MAHQQDFVQTDNPNYLINKKTNLVINTNESELLSYRSQVNQVLEMRDLRQELSQLKSMIAELIKK
jgi:hypothetical protein